MDESSIEKSCCRYAQQRGCWAIKLQGGITGEPDRGFVLPGHIFWPVEFKRPGRGLTPRQRQRHHELEKLGFHVDVIDTREKFTWLLDGYLQATA